MPQGSFTAQISGFVAQTKERILAVRNESAQAVVAAANTPQSEGGNLPFKTGFLRRSIKAAIGEPSFTTVDAPPGGETGEYDPTEIVLTIANAKIDDKISFVWTASYAMRMEWGFSGADSLGRVYDQKGYRFVGLASQQWERIVSEKCAELQSRASQ